MITVTLGTNLLPADDLVEAGSRFDCEFAVVSVTNREVEGTDLVALVNSLRTVPETAVYGEAWFGQAVYASSESDETLGEVLKVIADGSFPKDRSHLSEGELRQLRDALILEAHIRTGRDIFVTEDARAFIRHGRRDSLRVAFGVRILSRAESNEACMAGRRRLI